MDSIWKQQRNRKNFFRSYGLFRLDHIDFCVSIKTPKSCALIFATCSVGPVVSTNILIVSSLSSWLTHLSSLFIVEKINGHWLLWFSGNYYWIHPHLELCLKDSPRYRRSGAGVVINNILIDMLFIGSFGYQSIIDNHILLSINYWEGSLGFSLAYQYGTWQMKSTSPHRVEVYSPHLPDAYNSSSAELGIIKN
jgi:hypothetical protein